MLARCTKICSCKTVTRYHSVPSAKNEILGRYYITAKNWSSNKHLNKQHQFNLKLSFSSFPSTPDSTSHLILTARFEGEPLRTTENGSSTKGFAFLFLKLTGLPKSLMTDTSKQIAAYKCTLWRLIFILIN